MKVKDFFNDQKEEMPQWLKEYRRGDKLNFDEIFKHRVVFYPGSYKDGQPIKTFNKAHYAHTYLYVDYMLKEDDLIMTLRQNECFAGYELFDCRNVTQEMLLPSGWKPHCPPMPIDYHSQEQVPYCLLAIFERIGNSEEHGAERFAVIFLFADGIATYDALFVNCHRTPAVILIQDHGFGGNYTRFGKGGLLEKLANDYHKLPPYIMCEKENEWAGYKLVPGLEPEIGGMHSNRRYLYEKI